MATKRTRSTQFRFGDRVRCISFDPYTGISTGMEGYVDVVSGDVHPDPLKTLLMVDWDERGPLSVPARMIEMVKKGPGPAKVKPVTLLKDGKVVGKYETTAQAYAAAPQPWRRAYDQGYQIRQMTHVEETKAKFHRHWVKAEKISQ
jgi:hypothetical protein